MRQDFYRDIPGSQFFKQLQYLDSSGQEMCFRVERKTGSSLLLRLSPPDTYEEKRVEFKNLRRLYSLGIPMSYPQDLGFCSEGEYLYILFSDIQGQRADEVLPFLTPLRQYQLGISAGQILRKIHTLSPREPYDWDEHFSAVTEHCLSSYETCGEQLENEDAFLQFIRKSKNFLHHRPVQVLHGAFHPANFLITPYQTLAITGFTHQTGDPLTDFCALPNSYNVSVPFCVGEIDGYFSGESVPMDFFRLTAFYLAVDTLSSLSFACTRDRQAIQAVHANANRLLNWYQDFQTVVPSWYRQS